MSGLKRKIVKHLRSNGTVIEVENGVNVSYPKAPSLNELEIGEIAINYKPGFEKLFIKNEDNFDGKQKIVAFPSEEDLNKVSSVLASAISSEKIEREEAVEQLESKLKDSVPIYDFSRWDNIVTPDGEEWDAFVAAYTELDNGEAYGRFDDFPLIYHTQTNDYYELLFCGYDYSTQKKSWLTYRWNKETPHARESIEEEIPTIAKVATKEEMYDYALSSTRYHEDEVFVEQVNGEYAPINAATTETAGVMSASQATDLAQAKTDISSLQTALDSRVMNLGRFDNIDLLYEAFRDKATAGSHLMYGELASAPGARVTHSAVCVSISSDNPGTNGFVQYVFASSTRYGVGLWRRQVWPNGQGVREATPFVKVGDCKMSLSDSTLTLMNDAGATLGTLDLSVMSCIAKSSGRDANQMTIKNAAEQVLFTLPYATGTLAGVMNSSQASALASATQKNMEQDVRLSTIERDMSNYALGTVEQESNRVLVTQVRGNSSEIKAATAGTLGIAGVMSAEQATQLTKLQNAVKTVERIDTQGNLFKDVEIAQGDDDGPLASGSLIAKGLSLSTSLVKINDIETEFTTIEEQVKNGFPRGGIKLNTNLELTGKDHDLLVGNLIIGTLSYETGIMLSTDTTATADKLVDLLVGTKSGMTASGYELKNKVGTTLVTIPFASNSESNFGGLMSKEQDTTLATLSAITETKTPIYGQTGTTIGTAYSMSIHNDVDENSTVEFNVNGVFSLGHEGVKATFSFDSNDNELSCDQAFDAPTILTSNLSLGYYNNNGELVPGLDLYYNDDANGGISTDEPQILLRKPIAINDKDHKIEVVSGEDTGTGYKFYDNIVIGTNQHTAFVSLGVDTTNQALTVSNGIYYKPGTARENGTFGTIDTIKNTLDKIIEKLDAHGWLS